MGGCHEKFPEKSALPLGRRLILFFNKSWLDTSCEQSKTVRVAVDAQKEPKEGGGRETSLFNYGHDKYLEQKVQDVMGVMELRDLTWSRNERFLGESDVGT